MILGLIGNQRVGKDTIANYLVTNHGFKKFSFADPIKKVSKIIFGWTEEQCESNLKDLLDEESGIVPRDFFKWLGTNIMQFKFDTDFTNHNIPPRSIWAYSILKEVQYQLKINSDCNIVITDFRFVHEYNLFKEVFPDMNYMIVSKKNLDLSNPFNDWEYEIGNILELMNYTSSTTKVDIIRNTGTISRLCGNINTLMEKHKVGMNTIDMEKLLNCHHC